jgi:hypothetical protein
MNETINIIYYYDPTSRVRVFNRYPAMTLVQALSRIGGFVALIKLFSIGMYLFHWKLFEKRLASFQKSSQPIINHEESTNQ